MQIRRTAAALTSVAALSLSGIAVAAPAHAQTQRGLVNVNVEGNEILNNVGIGVAANVVAQICGVVQVGVISQQVARTGGFTCDIDGDQQSDVEIVQSN